MFALGTPVPAASHCVRIAGLVYCTLVLRSLAGSNDYLVRVCLCVVQVEVKLLDRVGASVEYLCSRLDKAMMVDVANALEAAVSIAADWLGSVLHCLWGSFGAV